MRLIDADKLEPTERYVGDEFVRIVYMDDIDAMPTIEAEPIRYGKWVLKGVREPLPRDYPPCYGEDEYDEETHSIIVKHWFCSECDYDASNSFKPKDNYCPNCGAKMDEVE